MFVAVSSSASKARCWSPRSASRLEEYRQFAEWAHDEAGGRLQLVHHASFNTLEENIEAAQLTAPYTDYVLLSYPANFYPPSEHEVFDYTRAFCEGTSNSA